MPPILIIIVGLLFISGFSFFLIFIPGGAVHLTGILSMINSKQITISWSSGYIYLILMIKAIGIISAVAILKRQKWARYLCLGFIICNQYGFGINNTFQQNGITRP